MKPLRYQRKYLHTVFPTKQPPIFLCATDRQCGSLCIGGIMRKKILVVDDEAGIREALIDVLESRNFTVLSAQDGVDALRVLEEHEPDVILSDLRMPWMDGKGLYELVKTTQPHSHIPFIFMSATPEKLKALDVYAVLQKPFQFENLISKVEGALGTSMNG
jgi:CheY-like chemotaxis protein